jgi:uncharacterized protein YndB with AHSA1/START domain
VNPDDLEFTIEVAAPPARVFAALTEARHLERWFCSRATSEARTGGELTLEWSGPRASAEPFRGRWERFDPPLRCHYQGGHSGYPGGDAGAVSFDLEPLGQGTRVIVRHRFPARPEYRPIASRYQEAWPRALDRLAAYLTPDPIPGR